MKFKIGAVTIKCADEDDAEEYARAYCLWNNLPALEPVRVFDEDDPRCVRCGYDGVWLSHNTREHYCIQCDEWFSEDEEEL